VQYAPAAEGEGPAPGTPPAGPGGTVSHTDVSRAEAWAAPSHRIASLTLRFVGRPVVDKGAPASSSPRSFEFASSLPAWLSRLTGTHPSTVVLGDEVPVLEEGVEEGEGNTQPDAAPPPPKSVTGIAGEEDDFSGH
jgi:hypothetical protein